MNIYALILLSAIAISISLGLSVYCLNRKATLNKLFMLILITNAYWSFCTFMMSQSTTLGGAVFWEKALFLWPFLVALLLHFTLVFTESGLLKRKLIYFALYFPPFLFSLVDLTTNLISSTPRLKVWGYATTVPLDSVVSRIDGIWAAVIGILVLFFFVRYYNRVIDRTKKKQTKFVAFGIMVAIVVAMTTDSIFAVMSIDFPVSGSIAGSLASLFVVYAIIKYELFSFRSEIAAENVFSTMPDSIILVSMKGLIIKVNRALVELTGYTEDELKGKSISNMLEKDNKHNRKNTTPAIMDRLIIEREIRNYEIPFYTKSGQKKIGTLSGSMITDSNGQDVGAAFVLHDISGRKEMEQKLIYAERFASIGELAGMVGHDLRNPLSGIRGAAYYLKRKHADVLDVDDQAMFESIEKSINYSNKIINDLLDYSSEIKLELTLTTPKVIISESLALIQPSKNVKVTNETHDFPELMIDEVKICRGFVNIIKNAIDAMPDGGELFIKSQKDKDTIAFTFTDTGSGMTKETLEKLWTPLFTTKAKGMGFGLAICKRTVEAHGGKITVHSVPEKGTTVKVELPFRLGCAN